MGKLSNWIEVISVGTVALGVGAAAFAELADPPKPHPANALILFGANWCAPCLAELRELPALARGRGAGACHPGLARRRAPTALAELAGQRRDERCCRGRTGWRAAEGLSAGLPYAVLLDGEGKRCAIWKGRMTPEPRPAFPCVVRPAELGAKPGLSGSRPRLVLAPDFLGDVEDEAHLRGLLLDLDVVAVHGRGEAALRRERHLADVEELGRLVDAALDVVLSIRARPAWW